MPSPETAQPMAHAPSIDPPADERPIRVLIVEDSEVDVLLLVWEFTRSGYEVNY